MSGGDAHLGAEADAAEQRTALRALLRAPLLLADRDADAFRLVRRHRDALTRTCADGLGYRLVVEPKVARLVKPGLGRDGTRPLLRRSGKPFTPRGYALLCVTVAALSRLRSQLMLDELVAEVRSAAADAGLCLDLDGIVDRRALHAALLALIDLGVLTERDGDLEHWAERPDALSLLDVSRDRLRLLVSAPLGAATSADDLLSVATAPSAAGGARVALRRHLVERPLLTIDDVPADHAEWWSKNRHREREWFADKVGLDLELRAEGAIALDPDEELTDEPFPGAGSLRHMALLWLGSVVEEARTGAGPDTGAWRTVPRDVVDGAIDTLTEGHASALRRAHREAPEVLRAEATALLERFGLVRDLGRDGWAVHAAAARYRPRAVAAAAPQSPSLFDEPALTEPALFGEPALTEPGLFGEGLS